MVYGCCSTVSKDCDYLLKNCSVINYSVLKVLSLTCAFIQRLSLRNFPTSCVLCRLDVRVPGYRSRGPSSIPGATRFSEKYWVWNLEEKVAAPVYKTEKVAVGLRHSDNVAPL
jgi:hypothetical protein